jgi:1-acyl-sn-glycerol-3-phosphate acyltransferase
MVDRLAAATCQHHGEGKVVAIRDLQLHRWLVLQGPTRLRCSVESTDEAGVYRSSLLAFREASRSELSRFEVVAEATVAMASSYGPVPAAWPRCEAPSVELPYDDGALFHGPAFQKLVALRRSESGAWGRLRAEPGEVPVGHLNQVLLDAATHLIPHDALDLWCPDIPADRVAYPYRIEQMELFGVAPTVGEVTCSARFAGMASERLVRFELEMHYQAKVWMRATLVEIVLPKGPIGQAAGVERKRFLADREYVEGVSLAQHNGDTTRLRLEDIKASNWLPGTLESLYSLDAAASTEAGSKSLAAKSHAAHCLQLHPSLVGYEDGSYFVRARPIQRTPVAWEPREGGLQLRTAGPRRLDIAPAKRYWSKHFGVGRWPVEDIYYGLIERFIHDLHLSDADNFEALRGKSVLYLANHQTAIESLLFSILVSGLSQTPTVTLAKAEHRDTWLGRMIQHCFRYPGVVDPKVITYFDRSDPESLGAIIEQLAAEMMGPGKSVMVHIEGTRAFTCREPVRKMTSKFIDMSIATGAPIVPVRFSGGLPVEALTERTEFPVAMGKQAIHIGKAIEPAELAALPYKERKPKVLEAINSLGPSANSETPIPGDEALARAVAERVLRTGASAEHATLLEVLSRRDSIHPELAALLRGDTDGHLLVADADSERWLAELAQRLYGPRGAKVATLDES